MNFQIEIKRLITVYSSSEQPIVQFRYRKLKAMNEHFSLAGFPEPCSLPDLSLLRAYFQEAIYDGINWSDQNAALRHLDKELELDCMFHNSGKMRKELTAKEFEVYLNFSEVAINGRSHNERSKKKDTLFYRLLAKIGVSF